MDSTEMIGSAAILCDQGDGWFEGLPAAVVGRVESIDKTNRPGRIVIWRLSLSLVAPGDAERPSWHGARVLVDMDDTRLGALRGEISSAPSVPAYLQSPRPHGETAPARGSIGAKVTLLPGGHAGHRLGDVGVRESWRGALLGIEPPFRVVLEGEVPWMPSNGRHTLRVAKLDPVPTVIPGVRGAFEVCHVDGRLRWSLTANGEQPESTTQTVFVRPDSTPGEEGVLPADLAEVTVVPVIELRDLSRISVAATFPFAKGRIVRPTVGGSE